MVTKLKAKTKFFLEKKVYLCVNMPTPHMHMDG